MDFMEALKVYGNSKHKIKIFVDKHKEYYLTYTNSRYCLLNPETNNIIELCYNYYTGVWTVVDEDKDWNLTNALNEYEKNILDVINKRFGDL